MTGDCVLDLQDFRNKIDEIDDNIVKLLLERFTVVKDIAEYKKQHGLKILQKNREAEILQKISNKIDLTEKTENQAYKKYMLDIYETILQTSKSSQN